MNSSDQKQAPVAVGSTGGSALTLMRGTPDEIERDLAAIDAKIVELTRQRDCAQKSFEYEVKSNIRLEAEIKRLRAAIESLADEAAQHGEYNPIGDIVRLPLGYQKIIKLAHAALSLPNIRSQPHAEDNA